MSQENEILLKMRNISKKYPGVQALNDVSFTINKGEVHAIVGENGAGKSTLMKILSGVESMTSGEIFIHDELIELDSIRQAILLGINLISQELNIAPDMTVYENIFIGSEINTHGLLNKKHMKAMAKKILDSLGAKLDINAYSSDLSTAEQQQVEIARALRYEGKILIMDEPTASLSENETHSLFDVIKRLRSQGITIIFISHRLPEVMQIADSVTVLRDGKYIGTMSYTDINENTIVHWMVGRELSDYYYHKINLNLKNEPYFVVDHIGDNKEVFDTSFYAKKGEILCLAGLVGAGRTELCQLIFGAEKQETGKIYIDDSPIHITSPADAIKNGIGYVPEDRKMQGLFLELSCAENIVTNVLNTDRISKFNIVRLRDINRIAKQAVDKRKIRTPDVNREVIYLSGGNQQKVLLARWLEINPNILILDEPTRGIDVGAKSEIYELIGELSVNGVTVIIVSSDLPEVIGLAQRILIMHKGTIVKELTDTNTFTQERILAYASGVRKPDYLFEYTHRS